MDVIWHRVKQVRLLEYLEGSMEYCIRRMIDFVARLLCWMATLRQKGGIEVEKDDRDEQSWQSVGPADLPGPDPTGISGSRSVSVPGRGF